MTRPCELCPEKTARDATLFCAADDCYLCASCDEEVHSANRLARRHVRRAIRAPHATATDGSSINDDSEAGLVPDVSTSPGSVSMADADDTLALPNPVPVSFEDAAGYDFCDFEADAFGGKMPALCGIDGEDMFGEGKLGKNFYGELSWENVVADGFEHVVPDVAELSRTNPAFPKREDVDVVVSQTAAPSVKATVRDVTTKEKVRLPSSPSVASTTPEKMECDSPVVEDAASSDSPSDKEDTTEKPASDEESDEQKMLEHRKKLRQEALARFRSKRANRSFTKKVRYECRKQLADSRPRVKGRFVRKIEMALFRKYGALYRDHLDELKNPQPQSDQCVPTR